MLLLEMAFPVDAAQNAADQVAQGRTHVVTSGIDCYGVHSLKAYTETALYSPALAVTTSNTPLADDFLSMKV